MSSMRNLLRCKALKRDDLFRALLLHYLVITATTAKNYANSDLKTLLRCVYKLTHNLGGDWQWNVCRCAYLGVYLLEAKHICFVCADQA